MMNYLSEILAFTGWKEVNQLPASAIALWYELMAICNKTGWRQEFTVPNGLLQIKAGLSRREFENARQLLIQAGRIQYKKSNRVNQAGRYEIIPFVQNVQQEGQQNVQQNVQRDVQRSGHTGGNETCTLFKLKHKQNINSNKVFPADSLEMFLAQELRAYILHNNPNAKVADNLSNWAKVFDLMLRVDSRKPEEIRAVMRFSQSDQFWMSNILSASKLREKFDTLLLQSQRRGQASGSNAPKAYLGLEQWAQEKEM
jgi:hypothetical protein